MKKNEIYKIWKDLWIDDNKIEKIILKITDLSKSQLFLCDDIDEIFINDIKNSFIRINNCEPIEYIINKAEFYWLDFYVDNRVLIPRNDTEIMVESVLKEIENNKNNITIIDVWTGSSCIAVSVLMNLSPPPAGTPLKYKGRVIENSYVIDISKEALEVSKINIKLYNLENQINQIKWDLLKEILNNNKYNIEKSIIITANLPYIKNGDFENMDNETIKFEPDIALYWWENTWFEMYERLINQCIELKKQYNLENIVLFIEIWFDQKEVCENFLNNLWISYELFKDNSGIERCVKIRI